MLDVTSFILDASIAAKWLIGLADEPFLGQSYQVLRDYEDNAIRLVAPSLIHFELGHALRRAAIRERITWDAAQLGLQRFLALPLQTIDSDELLAAALAMSERYRCSFYDGLYLALAEITHYPLIHSDERLHNLLEGRFRYAVWIGDYRRIAT